MGKYIKEFNNHSNYTSFQNSGLLLEPNVSLCTREEHLHYTPELNYLDYLLKYLTFVPKENAIFSFSTNNISYSLDNGTTWTTLTAGLNTPTINAGNKILWKASGLTPTSSAGIGTFSSTGQFEAYGNIMSLVYGDNFENNLTISNYYQFYKLFYNCTNLINVSNVILPATTAKGVCYSYMFSGCSAIIKAPTLPASFLENNCYSNMFQDCSSLKYVELTGSPSTYATSSFTYWLSNVATNGIFVKNRELNMNYASSHIAYHLLVYPSTWSLISSFTLISINSEGIFTTNPALWILLYIYYNKTLEISLNGIKFLGTITKTSTGSLNNGLTEIYTFSGTSDNKILELKQKRYSDMSGGNYSSVLYKVTGTNFLTNDVINYICKVVE